MQRVVRWKDQGVRGRRKDQGEVRHNRRAAGVCLTRAGTLVSIPFGTVPDHGIPCKQPTALRYLRGVAMVERGWQKWMDETNYGKGGTKDKTLKIRGNPKECSAIVPLGHVLRASGRRQTQRPMLHSQTELVCRRRWSLAPRRHCPCASPVARPELRDSGCCVIGWCIAGVYGH